MIVIVIQDILLLLKGMILYISVIYILEYIIVNTLALVEYSIVIILVSFEEKEMEAELV